MTLGIAQFCFIGCAGVLTVNIWRGKNESTVVTICSWYYFYRRTRCLNKPAEDNKVSRKVIEDEETKRTTTIITSKVLNITTQQSWLSSVSVNFAVH